MPATHAATTAMDAADMRVRTLLAVLLATAQGSSSERAERWVRPTTRVTGPVMRGKGDATMQDTLTIAGRSFASRLFLGTGKFPSNAALRDAIVTSGTEMV